jgi:hypothetical protein
MPTWPRRSIARRRAARLSMSWWVRIDSVICSPIRYTGFSDVIGSWKIIEISAPRISCIWFLSSFMTSRPL